MKILSVQYNRGFALPVVIITSVVMMIVLLSSISVSSSVTASLQGQYYQRLASEAAKAGAMYANRCLSEQGASVNWVALYPGADCENKNVLANPCNSMTTDPNCQLLNNGRVKSTFEVSSVQEDSAGVGTVGIIGTVHITRSSNNSSIIDTIRVYKRARIVTVSARDIVFGYYSGDGSYFATISQTGEVKGVGANGNGRLGNSTSSDTLTPKTFNLPLGKRGAAAFANLLSVGRNLYVLTRDGEVYGAGSNNVGQLGNGSTTSSPVTTPVKFNLPAGTKGKYVAMLADSTFVIGDNGNIYTAGDCNGSQLGIGCSSGSQLNPARVALPAVTTDPNTQPVVDPEWVQPTNMTGDALTMYVRMEGGAVYGWGNNSNGQLANSTLTNAANPVRIGSFGNTGQPKAVQIGQDGATLYLLDDAGDVWVAGFNGFGQFGGAATQMNLPNGYCMDVPGANFSNMVQITIYACNRGIAQKYEWYPDGTIRIGGKCIDNRGNANSNGNPIQLYDCNGGVAQQWTMTSTGGIRNPATGRCIDNSGNVAQNANPLVLYDCNNGAAQQWQLGWGAYALAKIPRPTGSTGFKRVSTDQYGVVLLDNEGKAWAAGMSEYGQLGTGSTAVINPSLRQVVGIPAGRTVVDIYTTKYGATSAGGANSYFILDDGTVYGAGSNTYGQLGSGTLCTTGVVSSLTKMNLPVGVRAQAIQSGYDTTIVFADDGRLYTMGKNTNGTIGDGTTVHRCTPTVGAYTNQRSVVMF